MLSDATTRAAMERALSLAADPGFRPGLNPRVGCVVLDTTGAVVGEGWHRGTGQPHAEVEALAAAGRRACGATAVVTLEPCNHTGRTGPCTDALLAAGVRRVVWGLDDPDPVAAGGGSRLRAAGVATTGGVLAAESADLNRSWVFARRHGRPYVTWKVAGSLDGRVAAADGTSRWISSPAARAEVHRLRAQVGAVLAGTGSVLVDDAQLAVRDDGGHALPYARQPLRVVLGRRPLPRSARVLDGTAETLQLTDHDPHAVLQVLAARRIHHVLLEGGPTVAAAFWRAGVVDEVIAYLAPLLLGSGPPLLADLGVTTLADAPRLEIVAADLVGTGPDTNVRITAHPDPRR